MQKKRDRTEYFKEWNKKYHAEWYSKPENRKKKSENSKKYAEKNKEKRAAASREYRIKFADLVRERDRIRGKTPERVASKRESNRRRKMLLVQASPHWVSKKEKEDILFLYELAVKYSKFFGEDFQVDHEIPILGRRVCGLHVLSNLRIVHRKVNIAKSNKFEGC